MARKRKENRGAKKNPGYVLSDHARDALAKRRISVAWMEQALVAPEWRESDPVDGALEHHLARIPAYGGRVLRVIINREAAPPRVVTVYFDRRKSREVED